MNKYVLQLHTQLRLYRRRCPQVQPEGRFLNCSMLFQPVSSHQDISSRRAEIVPTSLTQALNTVPGILEIVNIG